MTVDLNAGTLSVDSITDRKTSWHCTVQVNENAVSFKLDTGAEVTAITEDTHKKLSKIQLQRATKVLHGPTRQNLNVIGQFTAKLRHNQASSTHTIFVIRGLKNNLLGLPAIRELQLLSKVEETNSSEGEEAQVKERFGKLFQGLGSFGEEYTIKMRDDNHPHALFTPRNVPIPLQEELDRMEKLGVISRVEEPTPWCAGMVVVPKQNGEVRICVDLKPLNESVLHPIPKVDEILGQLARATVFSKLDANSGFWQIPLAKESHLLTTFITPTGRYCFNKLPLGISSAPEVFQKRMQNIIEGLDEVLCLIDDVLVLELTEWNTIRD